MKKFLKKNRVLVDIFAILLVAFIICIPYLLPSLDVFIDDGVQHIARAYGTFETIQESGMFSKVINSFSNGFGYSWDLFYGPLTTFIIMGFKLISPSYIVAYKLTCYLLYALSGIFMYKFVKNMVKNNNAGLLAAILYMTIPYHLTDLFTRNALGEFASFTFIPLVFLGINEIMDNPKKSSYYLVFGAVGLILVHNLSALLTCVFALFYFIYSLDKIKTKEQIKSIIKQAIFIVLITLFFILPLIQTKISAKYAVYEPNMMVTDQMIIDNELKLKQFVITDNDNSGFIFELGPHILIIICLSIMAIPLITNPLKERYILFLIFGFISLWMCTKYFPWMYIPKQLLMIQFPWRMMMFVTFFFSIICSLNIYAIIKRFNIKDVIVVSTISIIYTAIFLSTLVFTENLGDITLNENLGNFTGKEGETVAGAGKGEYLPANAYNDRFYLATREDNIYVIEGKATIENEQKDGSNYSAKIKTFDNKYTLFELPYIYYPGYEVRFDGIKLDTIETEKGFLGFVLGPNDNGTLSVKYSGTKIMKFSNIVSFVSFLALIICIIIDRKKDKIEILEEKNTDKEEIKEEIKVEINEEINKEK